jgi:cytochrome c oxidase assembly protein subunit 15
MTIILALWLWVKEPRAWVRWLGVIALPAVIFQGILGGLRVTQSMPQLGIFHAALAQLYFVLVAAIALFTTKWWLNTTPQRAAGTLVLRRIYVATAALIFLQLIIAATMRHQHAGLAIPDFPLAYGQVWPSVDPNSIANYNHNRVESLTINPVTAFQVELQMVHRVVALLVLAAVVTAFWKTKKVLGWSSLLTKVSLTGVGLIAVQILLGAATIWTNKSADIATAHVAVGALSFLMSIMLILISWRALESPAPAPAGVPLPTELEPKQSQQPHPLPGIAGSQCSPVQFQPDYRRAIDNLSASVADRTDDRPAGCDGGQR